MTGLSDIWGLEAALVNKADRRHIHTFSDIQGLLEAVQQIQGESPTPQTIYISSVQGLGDALDSKANLTHEHTTTQIADLDAILIALQDGLNGKAAIAHTHPISQITDLQSSLNTLQSSINSKAETGHAHAAATTSAAGFMSAADKSKLDGLGGSSNPTIADVQGLQSALDGKAASTHAHSLATTSAAGFMSAADKSKLDGFGGSSNPAIADVQGLQTALDSKSDVSHTHPGLPSGPLSALSYTFSQSSVMAGASGSYANLTDGNSATGAGTDATGAFSWLKADLGANKIISRIKLWGGAIPGWGDTSVYLKGAMLECSTDDTNWIILIPVLTGVVSANAVIFAIPAISARYVRINRPSYLGATEFVVYGQ